MKSTTAPLIVCRDEIEHGIDGVSRIAVRDSTPARNLVGFMLEGDANEYVSLRNRSAADSDNSPQE